MKVLAFLFLSFLSFGCFAAEKALLLKIHEAIGPATQDYIERNLLYAEKINATVVIIELNTPGGLETAMRGVNEAIITSSIPVITYVAPAGARAASAGTFIVYASHLAAMAPGTNIGAASPVAIMPNTDETKMSVHEKKAMNDATAYIKSLAELRGRNADWAQLAVKEGASISAEEAKRLKVIDEIAGDYPELLQKMQGHKVVVLGLTQTVDTKNLEIVEVLPDWRHRFLSFITDPNIAYILMLIAIYGLFFELANPGLILPGVCGVIALLLVLYAFQLMPINYAGLMLIVIGLIFMIFEALTPSFGVLGIGGVIAFMIGSIMLFDMQSPDYQLSWPLVIMMSIVTTVFFLMILTLAIRSHKKAIITGKEGLIGSEGLVISAMNEQIIVRVWGELWEARADSMLKPGQKIKVIGVNGLILSVKLAEE